MDFHYKRESGNLYQIHFTNETGLCLSSLKKYKAIIILGKCVSWCEEGNGNLDYSIPVSLKEYSYMVLGNLNCWDLLMILESDFNDTAELLEMCYGSFLRTLESSSDSDENYSY